MPQAPGPHNPGELFLREIREQPQALLRLLDQEADFDAVTKVMRERQPSVVRLVGHGSSDAAASFGVYAFGLLPGWTAMRETGPRPARITSSSRATIISEPELEEVFVELAR